MSYTPKHAKPFSSKDGKAGSPGNRHGAEAYAGRHTAPGGKPRRAPRTEGQQHKVAA